MYHKEDKQIGKVLTYEFSPILLRNLKIKEFLSPDEEWAKFVLASRSCLDSIHSAYDNNADAKYDVVIGPIADGKSKIFDLIEVIDKEEISIEDVDYSSILPPKDESWCNQISFHTKRSLSCIRLNSVL